MKLLIIGKQAIPEVTDYLKDDSIGWDLIIDESDKSYRNWTTVYKQLFYSSEKKVLFFGASPSIKALIAMLIARDSSIYLFYTLVSRNFLQRIAWSVAGLVVVPGGKEKTVVRAVSGRKGVIVVRPYLLDAHTRRTSLHEFVRPTDGTILYQDNPDGTELFLRAIAQTEFTALIPRSFLRDSKISGLVKGLGIRDRVIPFPTKLRREACLIADGVVVCFEKGSYPDVFFYSGANSTGWIVSEECGCKQMFNSEVVSFSEQSVQSLTDAMIKFDKEKRHLMQTVFVGADDRHEAVESIKALFHHVV